MLALPGSVFASARWGPVLDASGWAVNSRIPVNFMMGRFLTASAALPRNVQRSLNDPFKKPSAWKGWMTAVVLVAVIAGCCVGGYWGWKLYRDSLTAPVAASATVGKTEQEKAVPEKDSLDELKNALEALKKVSVVPRCEVADASAMTCGGRPSVFWGTDGLFTCRGADRACFFPFLCPVDNPRRLKHEQYGIRQRGNVVSSIRDESERENAGKICRTALFSGCGQRLTDELSYETKRQSGQRLIRFASAGMNIRSKARYGMTS